MKKSTNLTLLLILISTSLTAQFAREIFPFSREYFKGGLYVTPLATYSFGNKVEETFTTGDTVYNYEVAGKGKLSYGVEIGWYQTVNKFYVIDYIEAGLGYRRFKGSADYLGDIEIKDTPAGSYSSNNTFDFQTLTGTLRFMGETQSGNHRFFTYGLGLNYYYEYSQQFIREKAFFNSNEKFQNKSTLQAHIKFGYGFRVSDKILVIPTIETPLATILPGGTLDPRLTFFSAKYQPIIIGIKFMFMRKDPMNCNAPQLLGAPKP